MTVTQDIHCVTRWSRFDATFTGVPWSALRELVGQRPAARYAIAHAEQGFTANVPAAALELEGAMLATHADGEPLDTRARLAAAARRAGPVLLEERQVAARHRAHQTDQPGFWERYGYHNDADPWQEQRYGFSSKRWIRLRRTHGNRLTPIPDAQNPEGVRFAAARLRGITVSSAASRCRERCMAEPLEWGMRAGSSGRSLGHPPSP